MNREKAKAAGVLNPGAVPNPKARLLDQVREVIRVTTIPFIANRLTFIGLNGSSFSLGNAVRKKILPRIAGTGVDKNIRVNRGKRTR